MSKDKQRITRITAKSSHAEAKPAEAAPKAPEAKTEQKSLKTAKLFGKRPKTQDRPLKTQKSKTKQPEKPLNEVFVLARPFVRFGRYLRDSWSELRQVRWPNRKATWKMTLAVFVYCAILMVFILLLDTLFSFIFNLLINK